MGEYDPLLQVISQHLERQQQQTQQLTSVIGELAAAYRAPKRTMAVRDERGKIIGGETRIGNADDS